MSNEKLLGILVLESALLGFCGGVAIFGNFKLSILFIVPMLVLVIVINNTVKEKLLSRLNKDINVV